MWFHIIKCLKSLLMFLFLPKNLKLIMNSRIAKNFTQLKPLSLVFPVILLVMIVFALLYLQNSLNTGSYVEIQRPYFLYINSELSRFPNLIYNLTQLGDAFVLLSIISIFIVLAPKVWEAIIPASVFSLLFSQVFKKLFSVPRPAEIFEPESFSIIGKTLVGFSSLPSGHSITIFTVITVLMFGFMPKDFIKKMFWFLLIILLGFTAAFTRVGVGAHHPLDVICGSITGYICGLLGIFTMRKFNFFKWIEQKKWYPFFMVIFSVGIVVLIIKIREENLPIYYIAIIGLAASLYKTIKNYVQK